MGRPWAIVTDPGDLYRLSGLFNGLFGETLHLVKRLKWETEG